MNKLRRKFKIGLIVTSFILILIILIYLIVLPKLTTVKLMQTGGYIFSVHNFLQKRDIPEVEKITKVLDGEWQFLNSNSYSLLAQAMSRTKNVDRNGLSYREEKILDDSWGEEILIAARKNNEKCEFIIWSKGPDHIFGSKDDLSSPYNTEVPSSLKEDVSK